MVDDPEAVINRITFGSAWGGILHARATELYRVRGVANGLLLLRPVTEFTVPSNLAYQYASRGMGRSIELRAVQRLPYGFRAGGRSGRCELLRTQMLEIEQVPLATTLAPQW